MSLDLIKGKINQVLNFLFKVNQSVSINWVIPRVLNKQRIVVMREKIDDW